MKYIKKLPQVESACFCLTLRTGSVAVALIEACMALQSIVINILEICQIIDPFQHSFNLNSLNETTEGFNRDYTINEVLTDDILMIVLELFFFIACILLLVGVLKDIRKFIVMWMFALCIKLVLDFVLAIAVLVFAVMQKIPYLAFGMFILLLLPNAGFLVYCLIVVKSYFVKLEGGGEGGGDTE